MKIKVLTTSWERSWGATLSPGLGDTVLLFAYPIAAPRLYHTFFCPPLRIIGLNQRQIVFNQVVPPWRFVPIPDADVIIECDPTFQVPQIETILELAKQYLPDKAAWNESVSLDRLILSALAHAVADMRRVNEATKRYGPLKEEVLQARFTPTERGQIVNSAGFIQDFSDNYSLPRPVIRIARQVLKTEQAHLDDLLAASIGGMEWKNCFPNACVRCGKPATWRPIVSPLAQLTIEEAWRYQRPENAVPLCRKCAARIGWQNNPERRRNLALGVWGPRFDAFESWHISRSKNNLPATWNRQTHPLWPEQFGGKTWETGSGSLEHADPRPPHNIDYSDVHLVALQLGLGKMNKRRNRRLTASPPNNLVHY